MFYSFVILSLLVEFFYLLLAGYQQENDFDTVRTLTLNTPLDEFSSGIVTLSTHDVISLSAVTIQELTHSLEKNSCGDVNPMTDSGVNHRINSDNG